MILSDKHDLIVPAFMRAKAIINVLPLVKDARGERAKYIKLGTLLAAVEPVALEEQIVLVQSTVDKITDGLLVAITLRTTALHISGQWLAADVIIPVSGPILKGGDARGPLGSQDGGISNTYARRYGIFNLFSISVDEDTDGAEKTKARRARAAKTAEGLIDATARRTAELKDKVSKLVTAPEGCPTCKARQGTSHKKSCTDG